MSGHLQHHINAQAAGLLHDNFGDVMLRRIKNKIRLHLLRYLAAVLIHFNGKHRSSANRTGHRNREQTDRTASGDCDGPGCNFASQHRVHGIAQRIEDGRVLLRYSWIKFPNVRFWNAYILGKSTICIHADDLHELADMSLASSTLQTLAAGHMHFSGDEIAFLNARYLFSVSDNLTAEFVAGN